MHATTFAFFYRGQLALTLTGVSAFAQSTAPVVTPPPADTKNEETVQLSPFMVNTIGDEGYGTSAGLGGTRVSDPPSERKGQVRDPALPKAGVTSFGNTQ